MGGLEAESRGLSNLLLFFVWVVLESLGVAKVLKHAMVLELTLLNHWL